MRPLVSRLLVSGVALCCAAPGFGQTKVNYNRVFHQALALYQAHNYDGATAVLEDGLASATHENKPDWEAAMLGLLGPVYQSSGKYPQAEDALSRAIDGWTRVSGPNAPTLVSPLGNLGELYSNAGQPSRGVKLLLRAIAIENQSGREPEMEARLLTNLGSAYFQEHKYAL